LNLTATGVRINEDFIGGIRTQHKSGRTTVDVLIDSDSKVSTTVTVDEALTGLKTSFSFKVPDHKSGKVSMFRSKRGNISFPETQKMSSAMCAGCLKLNCIWPTCCVY